MEDWRDALRCSGHGTHRHESLYALLRLLAHASLLSRPFLFLGAIRSAGATFAHAQPLPVPKIGACPAGYQSAAHYCVQQATTRALLIANDFPHTELEQARVLVSRGLARGKLTLLVLPWDGSWRGTFVKFMIPHDARRHTVAPQKRCRSWELMP